MSERFEPHDYLRQLPERIGGAGAVELAEMKQEATEKVAEWQGALEEHRLRYQRYREAVERFKRGERKTKPSPNLDKGGRGTRSHREMGAYCGEWIQYWQKKLAIIEDETSRRR